MHSRPERLARGTVAAGVATFVAALSHAAGGGEFPSVALLAVAFLVSVGWCTAVVGRRFSWTRVSVSVVLSQALFHGTFALAGAPGTQTVAQSNGHASHGTTLLMTMPDAAGHSHTDAPMVLAHAAAALVTIVALRLGESSSLSIAALAHLVSSVVRIIAAVPVHLPPAPERVRPEGSGFRPSRLATLLGGLRHRGPPTFVTAA